MRFIILLSFLLISLNVQGQKNYQEAIEKGTNALKNGNYNVAIDLFLAAQAFDPSKRDDVRDLLNQAFNKINKLKIEAVNSKNEAVKNFHIADSLYKVTNTAKEEAINEKDKAKQALSNFYLEKANLSLNNKEYEIAKIYARKALVENKNNKDIIEVLWKLDVSPKIKKKWGFYPKLLGPSSKFNIEKSFAVFYSSYNNHLFIYEILSDTVISIETENNVYSLDVSPNGRYITILDSKYNIKIWDTKSYQLNRVLKSDMNTNSAYLYANINIDDNGNVIIFDKKQQDNEIIAEIWDYENKKKSKSYFKKDSIASIMRIGTSNQFALLRKKQSQIISILDLKTPLNETLLCNSVPKLSNKDGNWPSKKDFLISCPKNQTVAIWDYINNTINFWNIHSKKIGSYKGFGKPTFSKTGSYVAFQKYSDSDSVKFIINIVSISNNSTKLVQEISIPNYRLKEYQSIFRPADFKEYNECAISFSNDNKRIAIGDLFGNLFIFEYADDKVGYKMTKRNIFNDMPVNDISFSTNNNILLIYSNSHIIYNYKMNEKISFGTESKLLIFDILSNKYVVELNSLIQEKSTDISPVFFDNKFLITHDENMADTRYTLWDIGNLNKQLAFEVDSLLVLDVDKINFTENNELAIYKKNNYRIVNLINGSFINNIKSSLYNDSVERKMLKYLSIKPIKTAYNSDKDIFVYSDYKGNLFFANLNPFHNILKIPIEEFIMDISISPNCKYVAVKTLNDKVKIFNIELLIN